MRIKIIIQTPNKYFITIKEYYENKYFHGLLYPLIKPISTKQKYIITARIPKLFKKKIYFFPLQSVRISGKNINFDDKKINKRDFYKNKKAFQLVDIDVNKKVVSKEEPCGTKNARKYFTGYNDNDTIRPLCLRLPQMTGYVNKFDKHDNKLNKNGNKSNKSSNKFNKNVTMSVRVNNKQLLKNYNKIWEKK